MTVGIRNGRSGSCCCSCFGFINLNILSSPAGIYKIVQLVVGAVCQTMLQKFGAPALIGSSYMSMVTTNAACLSTLTLLLVCYLFSNKSMALIRSSILEILFNCSAALSYLSSSLYLCISVNIYLYPVYVVTLGFITYPAMIAAYMIGFLLSFLHAVDCYQSYKYYKGLT